MLHLGVGLRRAERVVLRAAGAEHELAQPLLLVHLARRGLRREALVGVVVPAVHELGAVLVQDVPEGGHPGLVAVQRSGAPARVVHVGADAIPGVLVQILLEPLVLLGAGAAAADLVAVAVQDHDVPGAQVVAVPPLQAGPGPAPEVVEVAGGVRHAVLVVAHGRPAAGVVAPPGRVVAAVELRSGAVVLLGVAHDADHAGGGVEEPGRGLVARGPAGGDVPEAEQHRVARDLGRRGHGQRLGVPERDGVELEPVAGRRGGGAVGVHVDLASRPGGRVVDRREGLPGGRGVHARLGRAEDALRRSLGLGRGGCGGIGGRPLAHPQAHARARGASHHAGCGELRAGGSRVHRPRGHPRGQRAGAHRRGAAGLLASGTAAHHGQGGVAAVGLPARNDVALLEPPVARRLEVSVLNGGVGPPRALGRGGIGLVAQAWRGPRACESRWPRRRPDWRSTTTTHPSPAGIRSGRPGTARRARTERCPSGRCRTVRRRSRSRVWWLRPRTRPRARSRRAR